VLQDLPIAASREGRAPMFARERTLGRGRVHTGGSDGLPWLAPALRRAFGFTGVLWLAGCASTAPVSTANLQGAQQAIAAAERSVASR
jgi:hypothetical protein